VSEKEFGAMADDKRPLLAITIGDAAGIGPEIVVKALARPAVRRLCRPLIVGDLAVMRAHLRFWPAGEPPAIVAIDDIGDVDDVDGWDWSSEDLPLLQPGAPLAALEVGQLSAVAGRGAVEYVLAAVALAKAGKVAGIVTAPLNKEAIHLAGYTYPGHTELLAEQFGVKHYSLVLSARGQFVFHVTTHVSLRQALDLITGERILGQVRLAHLLAEALGRGEETIAVAGINPHAGERGLFGREEIEVITPALAIAQAEGIPVVGPLPADVIFPRAAQGRYAFVIAMYHDQGHAVFKTLYFDEGVNVTVGLPVIRTSVDHGTAFDIAGQGVANDASLVEAIHLAARLGPTWGAISAAARRTL
jgi:4-phospho-D-threonate 3-dehydrogenase / 4-phospho-D-erythronate 3-dehydrogenase